MSRPARRRKHALVKIDGDLTIYSAATVQRDLLAALSGSQPVDLDLGEITEFDSAGVQQLLGLARECDVLGRPLRVVAASDCVREICALLGLEQRLALPPATP